MTMENDAPPIILVVEDVHETRDGIETLLTADGYTVASARDVREAIESARRTGPDLILVSLAGSPREVIFNALSIRQRADIRERVAVVVFCAEGVDEGDEVAIGKNVHLTHPDNFNQLRGLIARLLTENSGQRRPGSDETLMSINNEKPFTFRFIDAKPRILLELQNTSEKGFRSVEILTIFLKDQEAPQGGLSDTHLRFDVIKSISPGASAVVSHRTWVNGRPVNDERDQMVRLKGVRGQVNPYVLNLSWTDPEGKARFQRIPIGQ
jgi:CheY-like chemotaxis protein